MRHICENCIDDDSLKALLQLKAKRKCAYCQQREKGIYIEEMIPIIEPILTEHLSKGESYYVFTSDSDRPDHSAQHGDTLANVVQNELSVDSDAAEDIARLLIDEEDYDPYGGGDPFYTDEDNYERSRHHPEMDRYFEKWAEFSRRIRHHRRFFDVSATEILQGLFKPNTYTVRLPIIELGPGTKYERVFRARRADDETAGLKMVRDPGRELGAPPRAIATPGRMNAAGISVFYAAMSQNTAVAEIRPSVGGLVIVGSFLVTRKVKLLDLSCLHRVTTGSLFSPHYADSYARKVFLGSFHKMIAKPIQPRDEVLEYLPTQATAEFIAEALQLDGILYASAQRGELPEDEYDEDAFLYASAPTSYDNYNVVLFDKSSSAETVDFPVAPSGDKPEPYRVSSVMYQMRRASIKDPHAKHDPLSPCDR